MQPTEPQAPAGGLAEIELYHIETFLRQAGDHTLLLAVDALILRTDIGDTDKAVRLHQTIQGTINGKR